MRGFAGILAFAALGFGGRHGHARAVHFDIQHGNIASRHGGQVQLNSTLNISLMAARNVRANGFRVPFGGLTRHLQSRQQLHLLTPLIESRVAAHGGHHASHRRRVMGIQNIGCVANSLGQTGRAFIVFAQPRCSCGCERCYPTSNVLGN
jgi:hypothetical protein